MLNLPFVIQNVDNQLFLKAIFALAVYAFLRIGEITTKNSSIRNELVESVRLFDLCRKLIAEI
jgi:hypothetical protein